MPACVLNADATPETDRSFITARYFRIRCEKAGANQTPANGVVR